MNDFIKGLNNFINVGHDASGTASTFTKILSGGAITMTEFIDVADKFRAMLGEGLTGAMSSVASYFGKMMTDAIEFDLSIEGMLAQAEKTRKYFSELADEMNFYSSSTGSTTKAMGMLMKATAKSTASLQTLRGAFSSMVDAGADSDEFISDMLPLLGDFETKTGVGAQQFATLSTKFQQMFGEKKGITKDIQDLQKALIGTGLKGAQLEQTMQGLTEAAEKLAFATQGSTLNIKELSKSYGKTTAVFKAFGISAQTTTSFLNGLVDPENIEKNMLLMNKMGVSYQEFNEMLNSGQGQDKFFDKILNNVGKVAQEANLIQDAGTRFKYLKDTLGLPPEIANKLMKVSPNRMQSELRRIKREMEEAEKKDKWRKELKAREEKYEEAMSFLRMQMVAPLIGIIQKNRGTIMKFMKNITPIFVALSEKLFPYLNKLADWFGGMVDDIKKITSGEMSLSDFAKIHIQGFFDTFMSIIRDITSNPEFKKLGGQIINAILDGFTMYKTQMETAVPEMTDMLFDAGLEILSKQNSNSTLANLASLALRAGSIKGESMVWLRSMAGREIEDYLANDIKDQSPYYIPEAARQMANDNRTAGGFRGDQLLEIGAKGLVTKGGTFDRTLQNSLDELKETVAKGKAEDVREKLKEVKETLSYLNQEKGDDQKIREYMTQLSAMLLTGTDPGQMAQITNDQVQAVAQNTQQILQNNQESTQAAQDLANKKLTEAEVSAAVQKLMANKEFVTAVTASLSKSKDDKINALETQIAALTNSEAQLKKEFENLKKESVPAILREWQQFLFGKGTTSILGVLIESRDLLISNNEILSKQKANSGISSGQSDFAAFSSAIAGGGGGSILATGSSNLVSGAMSGNVKNLQVKQTMFLKAIADATFDSAQVLKYIGRNLIFTSSGLGVNTGVSGGMIYELGSNTATKNTVSGFKVLPNTAQQNTNA